MVDNGDGLDGFAGTTIGSDGKRVPTGDVDPNADPTPYSPQHVALARVPAADLPTDAGTYGLEVTVDGDAVTYAWVLLS